jgi:hypothetical protein
VRIFFPFSGLHAKPNSESDADKWFQRLENMSLLLEKNRKAGDYDPVKIAILDTGIDGNHPYRSKIKGYKDFVEGKKQEIDKTGHGTNGVHLIFKILTEAHIYVGRVFENEKANDTTPDLMAEVMMHSSKARELRDAAYHSSCIGNQTCDKNLESRHHRHV